MRLWKWLWVGALLTALIGAAVLVSFLLGRGAAASTAKGESRPNLLSYFNHVQSAGFADGGKTIVTVAYQVDKKKNRVATAPIEIRRWDTDTGILKSSFDITHSAATRAILTPDGGRVALLDSKCVTICSSTTGTTLLQLDSEGQRAEFSTSGKLLAVVRNTT